MHDDTRLTYLELFSIISGKLNASIKHILKNTKREKIQDHLREAGRTNV